MPKTKRKTLDPLSTIKHPVQSKKKPEPRVQKTRIRDLREKGVVLSQDLLGKLLDPPLDGTSVSRHESGDRKITSEYAKQYALIFRVQTHELFLVLPSVEVEDAKAK